MLDRYVIEPFGIPAAQARAGAISLALLVVLGVLIWRSMRAAGTRKTTVGALWAVTLAVVALSDWLLVARIKGKTEEVSNHFLPTNGSPTTLVITPAFDEEARVASIIERVLRLCGKKPAEASTEMISFQAIAFVAYLYEIRQ